MPDQNNSNLFVLTGAPGVGKTALLRELRQQGHSCVDEPARHILAQQRSINGRGVPGKDALLFTELMLASFQESHQKWIHHVDPVFFDRGVPDAIGYAALFGIDLESFETAAARYRYHPTVFLLPPWEQIYCKDEERRMEFGDVLHFHKLLCDAYARHHYQLIEVAPGTLESRASFVLTTIPSLS